MGSHLPPATPPESPADPPSFAATNATAANSITAAAAKRALLGLAPALTEQWQDGLLLRHARGFLPAANCAVPLQDGPTAQTQKLAGEKFFTSARMVPSFLLSDLSSEQPLDQLLARSGYLQGPVRQVMIAAAADRPEAVSDRDSAIRRNLPIDEFVRAYGKLSTLAGAGANSAAVRLQSLRLHALAQSARLHLFLADNDLGCLLAAVVTVDDQQIGVLADLFVAPTERRSGLGRALMSAGISEIGPIDCVLEVAAPNLSAVNLYRTLGFRPTFRWQYRTRPFTPPSA